MQSRRHEFSVLSVIANAQALPDRPMLTEQPPVVPLKPPVPTDDLPAPLRLRRLPQPFPIETLVVEFV